MAKANALCRRLVCAGLALAFVLAALFVFTPTKALDATQTLKVYAQYWADPDSATLLGEYSRQELDELSYTEEYGYEGYYCNVTRVHTLMRIHMRGVKLAEFLRDYVGVDLNSVRQLDFHTIDVEAGARFVSKGRTELLDSPHYYYPNLVDHSHYDRELDDFVVDDEAAALEGAVSVPTTLAVVQYATKNPLDDLTDPMTEEDTFRLCAGQPDLTTQTSFESARSIDEIYVVFAGSPPEPEPPTEAPTEPPTEAPTGSDDSQPEPEPPTEAPTKQEPATGEQPSSVQPTKQDVPTKKQPESTGTTASTTRQQAAVVTRGTVRRTTVRSTTSYSRTTRPTTLTQSVTGRSLVAETTAAQNMEQLVVNGYGDVMPWKKNSSEDVEALKKPLVTTKGARNAAILFGTSFLAGAGIMLQWFKKER